jgi:hypothetical protein
VPNGINVTSQYIEKSYGRLPVRNRLPDSAFQSALAAVAAKMTVLAADLSRRATAFIAPEGRNFRVLDRKVALALSAQSVLTFARGENSSATVLRTQVACTF